MHKLIEYVCDELDELEKKADKGKLSMSEIDYADKLAHLKKDLLSSEEMMEGYSGEVRGGSRGYSRGYYSTPYSRRSARRDSRGRYSGDYSMDNSSIVEELRDLMQEAPDERTKQEFQRFITKMETM